MVLNIFKGMDIRMANKSFYLSSRSLKDTKQLENVKLNSLIIAIALSINFIASVLNNVFNLSNLISILSILFFIYLFIRNRFRIKKRQIMFIAITGLPVLLSLIIGDLSNRTQVHYMLAYMMSVIIIVYFVSFGYDFKKICKYICFIFTTLIWTLLFFDISNYDYGALMGWSYSVIPFFLSSIYYLFYCDEDNNFIN